MKKILFALLAVFTLTVVTACGGNNDDTTNNDVVDNGTNVGNETNDGDVIDIRIALITHSPDSVMDDGSFNEGTWNGINQFLADNGLDSSHAAHFTPDVASDDARIDLYEQAINAGFNVLVLPGFHHNNALYIAQDLFPDTMFIIVDSSPENLDNEVRLSSNVVAVHHSEEEAGFLAGFTAVMEGYRNLGFMGGVPIPNILAFGYGYVLGAEHAAQQLGLAAGEVTMNYTYLGRFSPDATVATQAAAWFASGTEVIFAAAGGAGFSVMSAAEDAGASVIGVDVDQYSASDSVVFSALKRVDVSVHTMLTDILNGSFRGGEIVRLDARDGAVGVALENARISNFTQADFDEIFEALRNGTISVDVELSLDAFPVTELVIVTEF